MSTGSQGTCRAAGTGLSPWASYTLGHHPQTLLLLLDRLDDVISFDMPLEEDDVGLPDPVEIQELNSAMRNLAKGRAIDAALLVELRRELDCLALLCGRLWSDVTEGGREEWRNLLARCYACLEETVELANGAVLPTDDLPQWYLLGATVGVSQREARRAASGTAEGSLPSPTQFQTLASGLRDLARYSFMEEVARRIEGLVAPPRHDADIEDMVPPFSQDTELGYLQHLHLQHLGFARLDLEIRCALRDQPLPEPVLILDSDRLVFYGVERPFSECRQSTLACLWALAARAGDWVQRRDILRLVRPGTGIDGLKDMMHDVRELLRGLFDLSRARSGCEESPEHRNGFVAGSRGTTANPGPYKLLIPPNRVRCAPIPDWMRPRPGTPRSS